MILRSDLHSQRNLTDLKGKLDQTRGVGTSVVINRRKKINEEIC